MLNPRVLLTLAFKKMLYDNSRKMGNPVPLAPSGVAMDGDLWGGNSWCHLSQCIVAKSYTLKIAILLHYSR